MREVQAARKAAAPGARAGKERKGARGMPWLSQAMKDVVSCDKVRVGANNL